MKEKILGLNSQEVEAARKKYGTNALLKKKTKGILGRLIENLSDPIIRILLLATGLRVLFSFGTCNWFEIGGILIAVFVAASVTTVSEWGNEKTFEKMSAGEKEKKISVIRNGNLESLYEGELVVGDVVYLHAGECIPAVHQENVVDTTGAGDTFNGVLAAQLSASVPMMDAVRTAVAAAGLSVTRPYAATAIPYANEL